MAAHVGCPRSLNPCTCLRCLPHVSTLPLVQGGDTEWSVPNLNRASGLQELVLACHCCHNVPLSIKAVRVCTQLRKLSISGSQVVDLTPLQDVCASIPKHKHLRWSGEPGRATDVREAEQPQHVILSFCVKLEPLSACPQPKMICMSHCNSVASIKPLLACAKLEQLFMRGSQLPHSEVAALKAALPLLNVVNGLY